MDRTKLLLVIVFILAIILLVVSWANIINEVNEVGLKNILTPLWEGNSGN